MKKAILVFVLLAGLSFSPVSFSSAKVNSNSFVQCKVTEWVEYFLVGDQWYKITYYENGDFVLQAIGIPNND
jgi:hypothetical protein